MDLKASQERLPLDWGEQKNYSQVPQNNLWSWFQEGRQNQYRYKHSPAKVHFWSGTSPA